MIDVFGSAVSVSVTAMYRRASALADGAATPTKKALAATGSAAAALDVHVSVTIAEVRGLLTTQADERAHALSAAAPDPTDVEALMPEFWRPQAVSTRIVEFVRQAAGGDQDRLRNLTEAVETAFADVRGIFGGALPEVSERTIALVRAGLVDLAGELQGRDVTVPDGVTVELSPESQDLAAL